MNESLKKKKYEFLSSLYKVRRPSELEVKFMLKCDTLGGKGGANLPPKGRQTRSAPGDVGWWAINYDNNDEDDDDDDDDDNKDEIDDNFDEDNDEYDVFSWSKRTSNPIGNRGGPINYDDEDDNVDDDDDNNNDDDGDDVFSKNVFFVGL